MFNKKGFCPKILATYEIITTFADKGKVRMATTKKIIANGTEISVLLQGNEDDYICLTDMARYKDRQRTDYIIQNWIRARNTIEYLGVWEQLHNPSFNPIEFDGFRNQAGLHSFSLTPKEWVQKTNAIGLYAKAGRYDVLHRMAEEQLKVLNEQNAEFRFKRLTSADIN